MPAYCARTIAAASAAEPLAATCFAREQALRSATSVGANYRAACRARSTAEFLAKMGIVEEEADETCYWLDLLGDAGIVKAELLSPLRTESDEIVAMVVASIKTARRNR